MIHITHPVPSRAEKEAVWKNYYEGKPTRTPLRWSVNNRVWLLNPGLNTFGWTYADYLHDPKVIIETNARWQAYRAEELHPLTCDQSDVLPEQWSCRADVQNCYDAAFYGGKLTAYPGQAMAVESFLSLGDVDAFLEHDYASDNAIATNPFIIERLALTEELKKAAKDFSFKGRGMGVGEFTLGFDGVITAGAAIFGADFFLLMALDPEKASRLIGKLTRDAIARIRWLNRRAGIPERWQGGGGMADDSIQLLSCEMYEELVLPWHKYYLDEMSESPVASVVRNRSCHLCGDATRFFPLMAKELNIKTFDTGFPISFGELTKEMGTDITILGGVHASLLKSGTSCAITAETKRILDEVKPKTKKFIIREANNLSPGTPPENIQTMYEAVKKYGQYQ